MTRELLSIACLVVVGVSIPMILRKVPPNSFYGFRTPLTLSSPDIWYPANAFSGWSLAVAAMVSMALIWLLPGRVLSLPWVPVVSFLVPVSLSVAASFLYLRRLG